MINRSIITAAMLFCAAGAAQAALIPFNFPLTPGQEVPPNNSNAAGAASLIYDTVAQTFDFDLMVYGITLAQLQPTGPNGSPVHIHLAPPGSNGGIVVDLGFNGNFVNDGLGIRLQLQDIPIGGPQGGLPPSNPATNEAALFAGNLYVNVHTASFPGGQIRGQIIPAPAGALALMGAGVMAAYRRRR